jgi:hypothetical protein
MVPLMPDEAEIEEDEIIDHNDVCIIEERVDFKDIDQGQRKFQL